MISFNVPGAHPAPQGSKTAWMPKDPHDKHLPKHLQRNHPTAKPMMIESSSEGLKKYRRAVTAAARESIRGRGPVRGAVRVWITFCFPRPKAHYGTGRNAETLRDAAPAHAYPLKRGDIDKLSRALLDALADASVYGNDAQVVSLAVDIDLLPVGSRPDTIVRVIPLS